MVADSESSSSTDSTPAISRAAAKSSTESFMSAIHSRFSGYWNFRFLKSAGISVLIKDPLDPPVNLLHFCTIHAE